MTKRDMDERFGIKGDPKAVLRALLATDPEGDCPECGHAMRVHHKGVVCEIEGCGCHGQAATNRR